MTAIRKYNAKRDKNEIEIVRTLERLGCIVERLDKPVDLLVLLPAYHGSRVVLCEVKVAKGKFTESQKQFVKAGWPVVVLRSVDDAFKLTRGLLECEAA